MEATSPTTFREVMDLWPSRAEFERELQALTGLQKPIGVRVWYYNGRIHPRWFNAVEKAATARGFEGVTYKALTQMHKSLAHSAQPEN